MPHIHVKADIYTQDNKLAFIKNFDAAGEATITKVYNQADGKLLAWTGELSDEQQKILESIKQD
jgi:hypothetical protein